jgi:glutamate synthase domain-containing protein 1
MMLVPEAWENNDLLSREKKGFYEWSSFLMEPGLFVFSDGRYVGAVLDRNDLRNGRRRDVHGLGRCCINPYPQNQAEGTA